MFLRVFYLSVPLGVQNTQSIAENEYLCACVHVLFQSLAFTLVSTVVTVLQKKETKEKKSDKYKLPAAF